MELIFRDIQSADDSEHRISGISGNIKESTILAIIGNSAYGRTILQTLAGRRKLLSGEITINRTPKEISTSRDVDFVTSHPAFLPMLTVSETLRYAAHLSVPRERSGPKQIKVTHTVEKLCQLVDHGNTAIMFANGLVLRCLAIGCALLRQPSFIAVDEPFAGLTYGESLKLKRILLGICNQLKTGIVITMETPFDHVVCACADIILLHRGQPIYHGSPLHVERFLTMAGVTRCPGQNPLQFLMDNMSDSLDVPAVENDVLSKCTDYSSKRVWGTDPGFEKSMAEVNYFESRNAVRETAIIGDILHNNNECVAVEVNGLLEQPKRTRPDPEMTSFCNQFRVLTLRNFTNARRRILSPVSITQNLYILTICILIWWRPERTEETVKDKLGLFFFTTVQWAFFAMVDAILTFPKELRVFKMERQSGVYSPLAFCLSKTISEFPLAIAQPCVFMCVMYWVANLNNVMACAASLGVLVADVIAAQSIGLLISVALGPPWPITAMSLGLLSMMLLGGAFCTPPLWLRWGKFASFFTYGMNAFITLEFSNANPIRCAPNSILPLCSEQINGTANTTVSNFPSDLVLDFQDITWSVSENVMVLVAIACVTRILWCYFLRHKH